MGVYEQTLTTQMNRLWFYRKGTMDILLLCLSFCWQFYVLNSWVNLEHKSIIIMFIITLVQNTGIFNTKEPLIV